MPKNKPQIVDVPKANYAAVRGRGNPNEEGGAYQRAVSVLYAVAYTLKNTFNWVSRSCILDHLMMSLRLWLSWMPTLRKTVMRTI